MTTIRAHFDGHVLVPEEPADLSQGRILRVQVKEELASPSPLRALYEAFKDWPDNPQAPSASAA